MPLPTVALKVTTTDLPPLARVYSLSKTTLNAEVETSVTVVSSQFLKAEISVAVGAVILKVSVPSVTVVPPTLTAIVPSTTLSTSSGKSIIWKGVILATGVTVLTFLSYVGTCVSSL